jgi:hypothetical protein
VLTHLFVGPMCAPLIDNGTRMVSPNNTNSRTVKNVVIILLLRYTAFTRKRNKAEVDGAAITKKAPTARRRALQSSTGAADRKLIWNTCRTIEYTDIEIQVL